MQQNVQMARPVLLPSDLDAFTAGIVSYLAFGWVSAAEAATILNVERSTVSRLCRRFGINPKTARARYLSRLVANAEGRGSRPKTKHQMRIYDTQAIAAYRAKKTL